MGRRGSPAAPGPEVEGVSRRAGEAGGADAGGASILGDVLGRPEVKTIPSPDKECPHAREPARRQE